MARPNLSWGYTKSRDALRTGLKLGIGLTTVVNILADGGIEPGAGEDATLEAVHEDALRDASRLRDFIGIEVLGIIFGTIRAMVFSWSSSTERRPALWRPPV